MKKLFVVLLALTAIGVAAFAQDAPVWTFGAVWNTGAMITLGDSTTVPKSTIEVWDANEPNQTRARFIGQVDLDGFGAKWYVAFPGDQIITPAAPLSYVTFTNWWVYANVFNKMVQINVGAVDNGFSGTVNKGYGGTSPSGIQIVVMPIDGLKIGMGVPVNLRAAGADLNTEDTLKTLQFGAFYTMPNLASFALTYVMGKYTAGNVAFADKSAELAFGVNVLAVPNLTAQFEVDLTGLGDTVASKYELFENAAYVMGPLTPGITLYQDIYGADATNKNMTIKINPNVDYMVMTGTNVGLSVTYTMNTAGTTTNGLNVDPYVKFTFNPKAAVKIDANYSIADMSATSLWSLPININFMYSF